MENLIVKYLTDSISSEELALLKDWLKSPENQNTFKSMVQANHELDYVYRKNIKATFADNILEKITADNEKVIPLKKSYKRLFKYAAMLIIFFSVYIGTRTILKSNAVDSKDLITLEINNEIKYILEDNNITEIKNKEGDIIAHLENNKLTYNENSPHDSEEIFHELNIPNGKIFSVVLPDKSTVFVNSGSTLKYTSTFNNGTTRDIYLDGEAYFEVTTNKELPFIVKTNDMNVRVLGTKFNVTSYRNETNSSVALEEGSVSVMKSNEIYDPEKSLIIKPNQRAVLEKEKFTIHQISNERYYAWKKRQLLFKNDRFEDIVKKLERYYNLSININSSNLNNNRYTGTFSTESITNVLDMFKEIASFDYKLEGKKITITEVKIKLKKHVVI